MKNFVQKNGDAIINYGAWICSGLITLACLFLFGNFTDIARKTGDSSITFVGIAVASLVWVAAMLGVVSTFYFLYSFIDMRNNLNDIKNILIYNGGNINNQPNLNVKKEYTQSYQSVQNLETRKLSESIQTKPSIDNQEQNIDSERQIISNNQSKLTNSIDEKINIQNTDSNIEQTQSGSENQDQNLCHERQSLNKEPLTLKIALKNWWKGKFKGRCSLLEYWVTAITGVLSLAVFEFVAYVVVFLLVFPLGVILEPSTRETIGLGSFLLLNIILFIVTIKSTLALIHRRFLDFDLDIPVLVMVIFFPLIQLLSFIGLCVPGNKDENEFGLPSPYYFDLSKLFTGWKSENKDIENLSKSA